MSFLLKLLTLQNCVDQLNKAYLLTRRSSSGYNEILSYPLIIKFRMEVLNFVKQLSNYIHEIAVKQTWQQFMDCVLDIEEYCKKFHEPEEEDEEDEEDDEDNYNDNSNKIYSIDEDDKMKLSRNHSLSSLSHKSRSRTASSLNHSISLKHHRLRSNPSTSSLRSSRRNLTKTAKNLHKSTSYEILNNDMLSTTAPKTHSYHGLKIEYNFEGLYLLHHDYLKRILYRCFLHAAAEPLQQLLMDIFEVIEKFCRCMVVDKRMDKEKVDELYSTWKSKHSLFIHKLEFLINKDLVQGDYAANSGKEGRWIFNELLKRLK